MGSRRLSALLVLGLVSAAACGGSAAQREALEVQSQSPGQAAPAAGDATAGGTDYGSAAPDAATPGDAGSTAGSPGAGGGATSAAPSAGSGGAAPAAAKPGSPTAAAPRAGQASSGPSSAASPTPGQAAPAPVAPGPGSATGGATDEGVTATSVKVGHIGIYSGPVGSFGDDLSYAGRAVLQSFNDAGGINGRKLDVLVRDDAWDGTKGMNAARDLVERQKVFAICCIMSVNTSDPLTPYLDQKKIPHVGADGWGEPQYSGA